MKAAIYNGPGAIGVEDVPDPRIEAPTDALVRVTHACICGSDLWFYRGVASAWKPGMRTGHEWMGIVEEVGSDVTSVKPGDHVIAPFVFSDGTCEFCREGLQTSCEAGGAWGGDNDGGQAEAVRAQLADGTLVVLPSDIAGDEAVLKSLLPLTDVMGTGHHAALAAGVGPGSTAVVVGDGAVGLCAVLAAARLGAERVVIVGHHEERLKLATTFGATDVVGSSGDAAVEEVRDLTDGGAASVMECVGNQDALDSAAEMARPGGAIGFVGVPHGVEAAPIRRMFSHNIALRGGVAPVRAYLPELMRSVLDGTIDPGPVLDLTVPLDDVAEGYAAMDSREAIKVMVRP
ncbi:MAG TPA: zinc-dependent alcohol dehydrogenase family protein [Actinomycetota bacterium]|nr:zinc-dependent alcohol dehydrogenase family protein [Actinomycetota bacterium]